MSLGHTCHLKVLLSRIKCVYTLRCIDRTSLIHTWLCSGRYALSICGFDSSVFGSSLSVRAFARFGSLLSVEATVQAGSNVLAISSFTCALSMSLRAFLRLATWQLFRVVCESEPTLIHSPHRVLGAFCRVGALRGLEAHSVSWVSAMQLAL